MSSIVVPPEQDQSILSVLRSRKFWFAYAIPVVLTIAAALLHVVTPEVALATIGGLSATYGATIAAEDIGKAHANAAVEVAHVQAASDQSRIDFARDTAATLGDDTGKH